MAHDESEPLVEHEFFKGEILEEKDSGSKYPRIIVQGIFQLGDVRNRNKRVYPNTLWQKLCSPDSDLQQRVGRRRVIGEMAHPKDGKGYYPNASHLVTEVWAESGRVKGCEICEKQSQPGHLHVMGKEEVLDTPHGKILKELYERECEVGISSRGSGSLKSAGNNESVVQDDYKCETWDHVSDPSTPGCWPKRVNESVVDVVSKLVDPVCDPAALNQYRGILSSVLESEHEETESKYQAKQLIEVIDTRLASPACTSNATTFGPPTDGWLVVDGNGTGSATTDKYLIEPSFANHSGGGTTASEEKTEVKDMSEKVTLENSEIQSLLQSKLREMKSEFDAELAQALKQLDAAQKENGELQGQVAAHEETGREMSIRLREAELKALTYEKWINEQGGESEGGIAAQISELSEKHDLALQVIDELVGRVRKYKVFEKKAAMATKVLGETIAREKRREVVDHVDAILSHENQSFAHEIRSDLLTCESIEDVNKQYGAIKRATRALTESAAPAAAPVRQAEGMSPEGALPTKGDINEEAGQTTEAEKLPPSQMTDENTQVNESVALSRALTRKVNPHRSTNAVNG